MLLAGLYLGTEIGFGGWIISIAAATTHAPPAQLAPAASAFWICLALGGAPTVLLLRRGVAPRHLMIGGALAAAATALLLLLLSRSVPLTIACCALMGLVIAPILPQTTATAARQGARDASDSLRVAALFTVGQIGAAALPALQGVLLGVGPTPALLLTVVGATAMALLAYAVAPSESIP
jgi:fucose permease